MEKNVVKAIPDFYSISIYPILGGTFIITLKED